MRTVLFRSMAAAAVVGLGAVIVGPVAANSSSAVPVSGAVTRVSGTAQFAMTGGVLYGAPQEDVQRYMLRPAFYVVQGHWDAGHWVYPFGMGPAGAGTVDAIQIGSNDGRHTELVAVGAPSANAPTRMTDPSGQGTPPAALQPNVCYPNEKQAQATTTIYEYWPGLYPARVTQAQAVASLTYYYNGSDVNCLQGTHTASNDSSFPQIANTGSFLTYVDSGPKAVAAQNQEWKGTDLNGLCVEIDMNGQTIYGSASGGVFAVTSPAMYYCDNGQRATDFVFTQVLN